MSREWPRLLAFALLLAPVGWTAPSRTLCPERPIQLAFYEFGRLYDSGTGIDRDLVTELQRRSGCTFQTQVMARARIWTDLEAGALDMTVSGIRTPQRDAFAWFAPYLSIRNETILGPRAATVRSANDFLARPELVFGVVRSFRHGAGQDSLLARLRALGRVEESPDAPTLFQKLKAGRIDALFSQAPVHLKYRRELGLEASTRVVDWFPAEPGVPHGLVLSRRRFDSTTAAGWNDLVQSLRSDGTLLRLFARHVPDSLAHRMLDY